MAGDVFGQFVASQLLMLQVLVRKNRQQLLPLLVRLPLLVLLLSTAYGIAGVANLDVLSSSSCISIPGGPGHGRFDGDRAHGRRGADRHDDHDVFPFSHDCRVLGADVGVRAIAAAAANGPASQ